jgi:putative ABC transport system permease protein
MTFTLALRNLTHDRTRLAAVLTGVAFAVALITTQLGLFVGFATTTSSLIDRARADLWIASKGTRNVDQSAPISERRRFQALSVPGVAAAELYIADFARWQKPGGGTETVLVVGFDPETDVAGPWSVVAGDVRDLRSPGTIMIDELYAEKLGVAALGQLVELQGWREPRRARVIGFTNGIRSFTQSPYVFASFKTARDYAYLEADQTKYVLVNVVPGADPEAVRGELLARLPGVDVMTAAQFSARTRLYWMFTTGAGLALLVASFVGLVVGFVVVAQTLYATTIDHLREFGTLRAIGASRRYLHQIVLNQAAISAVLGYSIGLAVCLTGKYLAGSAAPAIVLSWALCAGVGAVTFLMCLGAGMVCIRKIVRLDPAMVFK